ncbi:hypothetical protein CY34DRAFT_800028 [Suillus luteus UH-Slu-Lm8-n1]|uniref:F-box domain-containing protein n=1 Tax=Suillus luteus UH-Slu-Lm8-n1 TaxID=930992 RepID=A0A0D0BV17_9AGAM|nr:hypothetical protein CY34DRAFT_800028 [Suillus luteus UH-Slu-Lm8-n1]
MSCALFVPEILSQVINHINITGTYHANAKSGRSLLAIALTCRSFSEQALDALWESLEGIDPVMQCAGIIVPDILTSCNDLEDCRIIPTESQMVIVDRYAHRVRFLKMTRHDWQSHLVQSFLQTLAYSAKVLMPNLRCLSGQFSTFSSSMLHLLRPLLGPRLQDISIDAGDSFEKRVFSQMTALHVVLQTLHSCCPFLEIFCFDTYGSAWDAHTARAASHSIQRLQKLRSVAVPAITKDALAHLGGLPCLASLDTYLPTGNVLEEVFRSSRTPFPFENLRSIDWEIEDWADVEVFTRLWSQKLTRLSLRSKIPFDPSLLQTMFESFHTSEAFKDLQSIHFTQSSGCPINPTIIFTNNTIRPLLHLRHLRVVEFDTVSSIWVDNDDLKRMAKAWPCLKKLSLNETYGCHNPTPRVTLLGLVEFIELCPLLTTLYIGSVTLAASAKDVDEGFLMGNIEPCRSRTLGFLALTYPYAQGRHGDFMWRDALEDFLATLFPSSYVSITPEA